MKNIFLFTFLLLFIFGLGYIFTQKTCKAPYTFSVKSQVCVPRQRWQVLVSEALWDTKCSPLTLTCPKDELVACANDLFCNTACHPETLCQP